MSKLYMLIALILFSTAAQASPGAWMPVAKNISGIIVEGSESSGTALILIDGGVPSAFIPPACNSPYNTIDLTTEKGRAMLSLAISAKLSNQPVKLALTCQSTRPFITHIWL